MARAATKSGWARRTYLAASVAFAGALAALGAQMSAGADPAVRPVADAAARPQQIITRKIVRTTVVTRRVVHRDGSPTAASATVETANVPSAAPPQVAPARPVVQAPAPAPAPVTRAS